MPGLYQYKGLDNSRDEIRLIDLLPGAYDDPLEVRIFHAGFKFLPPPTSARLSRDQIQLTLPKGWKVLETLEGRMLFSYTDPNDSTSGYTTWVHPGDLKKSEYDPPIAEAAVEPKFEALSYTWGTPSTPEKVVIDPVTSGSSESPSQRSFLPIGVNLADALRDLRCARESRTLWVDAICINQQDISERDVQVARMGNIYKYAHRVIVYLGRGTSDSDLALSNLEYLGKQVECTKNRQRTPSPNCSEPMWFHSRTELLNDSATWNALHGLLSRPWFDRLWVLQEIQLANHRALIVCGKATASWYFIRRAMICYDNKAVKASPELRTRFRFMETIAANTVGSSLQGLLAKAKVRKCAEPKDKVYAILGLLTPKIATRIVPSYNSKLEDVYRSAFLEYVDFTQRLDLLEPCDIEEKMNGLPTWVPNWAAPARLLSLSPFGYAASGISRSHSRLLDSMQLEVIGVHFATIEKTSPVLMDGLQSIFESIRDIGLRKLKTGRCPTGVPLLEALAWVISFGQVRNRKTTVSSYPTLETWKKVLEDVPFKYSGSTANPETAIFNQMVDHASGRRLMFTRDGHIGTVSAAAKPDDQICIILGCPVPMVLREKMTGQFEVIGPCYVHGAMDGEALLGDLPHEWHIRPVLNANGLWEQRYFCTSSGSTVEDDPRLGSLPDEWEKVPSNRTSGDPLLLRRFKHRLTGELINSDPRLFPAVLEARHVPLVPLLLV